MDPSRTGWAGLSERPAAWAGWAATGLVALVVAAFLVVTPTGLLTVAGMTDVPLLFGLTGAVSVAAVVLAHRWPVPAAGVAALPFVVVLWSDGFVWGWLLGMLGVMVVAAARRWQEAVPAWALAVVVSALYCFGGSPAVLPIGLVTSGGEDGYRDGLLVFALYLVWITGAFVVAAVLGSAARLRLHRRAVEIQERHAFEVEHVTTARARMARDLHDVVAHHVSLIAVRAESAPYQHPGLDPAARQVLAAIAADARSAIGELRHALTVLRRAEDGTEGAEPLRPQPDAAAVPDLLREAQDAGQPVRSTGGWREVPAAQGYVLYRAVQEGLTNARRHAPGTQVVLAMTQASGRVGFVMSNAVTGDGPPGEPGRGLLGMAERVTSVGGSFHTGVDAGRFVLAVDLPDGTRS